MIFHQTQLHGLVVVVLERVSDERGSFARTFDAERWEERGMAPRIVQASVSHNLRRGTLRGLHYQAPPHAEDKLVRCCRGAVYDVVVDLRADSPTYCRWFGLELSAGNDRMLYVPAGLAHGFLTLTDDVELEYQMSREYSSDAARGVRWDDPAFGIAWPETPRVISDRDQTYPDFRP